jgi:hypothetical protein
MTARPALGYPVSAAVRFYEVSPRKCRRPRGREYALPTVVACIQRQALPGIGLRIDRVAKTWVERDEQSMIDFDRVVGELRKKFDAELWTARVPRYRQSVDWRGTPLIGRSASATYYLHLCRELPAKADVEKAKAARDHAVNRLRHMGYEVEMVNEDGGRVRMAPTKQRKAAAR